MKHKIAVVGLGGRGKIHLTGILGNPERFELTGVYDPSPEAVKGACEKFKLKQDLVYPSAEELLSKTKPEVLAFITHPDHRLDYVEMGIKYGVKCLSFEKPMALTVDDARKMTRLCVDNGVKAVVSHQQKYMRQMQDMYKAVRSGSIGQPELIRIFMRPWASQLATHFIDYALWANGGVGAEWVVGHVSGKNKLYYNHPSPDYMMGEAHLKNGVTLFIESGYLAPFTMPDEDFWTNNRITVYGTHGYAWAETNGRCCIFSTETQGKQEIKQYGFWNTVQHELNIPYYTDLADWLDNDNKKHSCNIEISLHGYEIMEGIYKSALENTRVDLPITGTIKDYITEMKQVLPDQSYPEGFEQGYFYRMGRKA
jgi:predicted dehydrogenase